MGDSYTSRNSGRKRSNDDDDPKKRKNRDAARKCREKKMKETEKLKKENEELVKINEDYSKRKRVLEQKLSQCIAEIKKHEASGCSLPPNVASIIHSSDSYPDDIPVDIQPTPVLNALPNTLSYSSTDIMEESQSPPTEFQPTVTGLFSGDQYPASGVGGNMKSNLSSRSSSMSPHLPPRTPQSQTSISSSMRNANLSWTCLHQQLMGEGSPGLSPAQTVPNIDTDICFGCDRFSFPDSNVTLQNAQEDQGITVEEYQNDSNQGYFAGLLHCNPDNNSISSLAFSPQLTPLPASPQQGQYIYDQNVLKGVNKSVPVVKNADALKPSSSASRVVNMNHTAELLSQAMTNFEASEISEDLKNQFASVANKKENKEEESSSQKHQNLPPSSDWYIESENHQVVQEQQSSSQMQPQSSAGNETLSYEGLLKLAENEQSITVQYQGRDYVCNYEQLKQLIQGMRQDNLELVQSTDLIQGSYSEPIEMAEPVSNFPQNSTIFYGTPQEITNATNNPDISYVTQKQNLTVNNSFGQRAHPVSTPQHVDTPIQNGQLPTTVLSMIQEEVMSKPGPPNEQMLLDSIDYSENVKELPSLSLTEDHSRIFEKKRKQNHELTTWSENLDNDK